MLKKLTPQQESMIPIIRDKWIRRAHSGQFNEAAAKELAEFVYQITGLDKPQVIYCGSPMAARIAIAIIKTHFGNMASVWESVGESVGESVLASVLASVKDSVGDSVLVLVRDSVRDSVGASVGASVLVLVRESVLVLVRESVLASVGDSVGESVGESVLASVLASVKDSVGDSVGESVGVLVRDSVRVLVRADYYGDFSDYNWLAFYDYFRQAGHECEYGNFKKYSELFYEANQFECFSFKNQCFVVRPPKTIIKNEAGRLHNTNGPAIVFPDGYSQYYINGRNLPAWIWEEKETITRDRFLQEKNAEIRGGMYAVLGQKKVFDLIGAEEICRKSANNETYILYRTKERIGDKYWQWVGVTCPSTGTNYLLGVPETVTCPIEACAGTFGLSSTEYIISQHT